jgi:hypothetical protein
VENHISAIISLSVRHMSIQGGPTLTIFAITRFLIIEKKVRLARKRHTYGAISLSHYFIYYQLGFASGGDKVKLIKIRFTFFLI